MSVRECLLFFAKTDGWWDKFLGGYTHVSFGILDVQSNILSIEPTLRGARLVYPSQNMIFLETLLVKVALSPKNLLIGPTLQTCATIVQYLAGFDLGALRCQKLYDLLTTKDSDWLLKKGILEVKKWEQ